MRGVAALRKEPPDIAIHVRADAGFGGPRIHEGRQQNNLTCTPGFSAHARLKKMTGELMARAVEGFARAHPKQRLFDGFDYPCDSWDKKRKAIVKAECHERGTHLRFVIANRTGVESAADGACEYDPHLERGESEQRMDELKNGLSMDRRRGRRFMANFFRLLLRTAAMNLLNAVLSPAADSITPRKSPWG